VKKSHLRDAGVPDMGGFRKHVGKRLCLSARWQVGLLAVAVSCLANGCKEREMNLHQVVPREIDGWKAEPAGRGYDRKTLFHYIDGGAELYLSYGFQEMLAWRFHKAGQPDIIVDLFDMGSSQDAFGVFSAERQEREAGIGQGSEFAAGLLRFWKDRFFVSVWAETETPQAEKAVLSLGAAIAGAIKRKGSPPQLLHLLPEQGLIAEGLRYFHDHHSLNYHYFVADENLLGLSKRTEALLAPYRGAEGTAHLLLVRYPTARQAQGARRRFLTTYLPTGSQEETGQNAAGKWVGVSQDEKTLMVVLDVAGREQAEALLGAVRGKLRRGSHERR